MLEMKTVTKEVYKFGVWLTLDELKDIVFALTNANISTTKKNVKLADEMESIHSKAEQIQNDVENKLKKVSEDQESVQRQKILSMNKEVALRSGPSQDED